MEKVDGSGPRSGSLLLRVPLDLEAWVEARKVDDDDDDDDEEEEEEEKEEAELEESASNVGQTLVW